MNHSKLVCHFIALLIMCVSSIVSAKVIEPTFDSAPHSVVQDTTKRVIVAITSGLDPVKEPELFVSELSKILEPAIAFDFIARGVMGNHADQVTKEQASKFAGVFKAGLVTTYGKGISNFSDLTISVLPPEEPVGEKRRTAVVQEIKGGSNTNLISYSMAKNNQGQWKVINVVLNGINLGQTFRGQFSAEVRKNKGDVVKTINEWGQR